MTKRTIFITGGTGFMGRGLVPELLRRGHEVRAEGEALLRASGMNATILRPWYVLGPGRQWPRLLKPLYWLLERVPSKREAARRLGLMTDAELRSALLYSVENPGEGVRVLSVPEIKEAARGL